MSSPVEKDLTVRVQLQKGLQKYLDRGDITEIAVNRPGFVWVEEASGWRRYEDINFTYDYLAKLGNVCAVYGGENKTLDSAHPVLSVELPDGERAQFVMPPACKNGTISLTVRKISKDVIGLDSYIQNGYFSHIRPKDSLDPINEELSALYKGTFDTDKAPDTLNLLRAEFLKRCVETGKTIVIAGETGSGKTTFMKALMQHLPFAKDSVSELLPSQSLPDRHAAYPVLFLHVLRIRLHPADLLPASYSISPRLSVSFHLFAPEWRVLNGHYNSED